MHTPTPKPLVLPDIEAAINDRWNRIHAGEATPTAAEQRLIEAFEARQYQVEATDETPWDFGLRALGSLAPAVDDDLDHGPLGRFAEVARHAWRVAMAKIRRQLDTDALGRWGFQAGQVFEDEAGQLSLTVIAVHGPDSLAIQGPKPALVDRVTEDLSASSLELRLLSAGFEPPFAPNGEEGVWVPPTTNYLFHRWAAIQAGRTAPRTDEQRVMDAVGAGLDAGIHRERALDDYVVKALGGHAPEPAERLKQDPSESMGVEDGVFGMLVYYARQEVERRRAEQRAAEAMSRWGFAAGQRYKAVRVRGARYSSAVIQSVDSPTHITLMLTKRGSSARWQTTANAVGLVRILEAAGYAAPIDSETGAAS